jgi:hypothetical protein
MLILLASTVSASALILMLCASEFLAHGFHIVTSKPTAAQVR